MNKFSIFFIASLCTVTLAQNYSDAYVRSLIPEGYTIAFQGIAEGDLNFDDFADVIVVLDALDAVEIAEVDEETRPLMIFFGQDNGELTLYHTFTKVNLCQNCGGVWGDPFESVTIDNGTFTLVDYGGSSWRWSVVKRFSFSPESTQFYLELLSTSNFHASDPENTMDKGVWTRETFGTVPLHTFDTYALERYQSP